MITPCQFISCRSRWLLMWNTCQWEMSAWVRGVWVNAFGRQTCGRNKEGTTLCVMVFCVGDGLLGIPREQDLYSMQHKHCQLSTGRSTSQSVRELKREYIPSPTTEMILTHAHTTLTHIHRHRHAYKPHVCSKAHTREPPHTNVERWPLSPSHTQLSSMPSPCLFVATPVLIPSHSISITSANSPSSPARTVFLLPFMLSLVPYVSVFLPSPLNGTWDYLIKGTLHW